MRNILKSAFLLGLLFTLGNNAHSVEEAKYSVVYSVDAFEVRYYDAHILAELIVTADFEEAGDLAFKPLFNYITGSNIARSDIAMTAPVLQKGRGLNIPMTSPVGQSGRDNTWVVSFMMPSGFSLSTLPQPLDPNVSLRLVPARYIASVEYSGFWSESNYQKHYQQLEEWTSAQGYICTGNPIWARYNAPFTPWFLRRNEIQIPIENPNATD